MQMTLPELLKVEVVLNAIRGEKMLSDLSKYHDVYPNQITDWKSQLQDATALVAALDSDQLAGVLLDVLSAEPLPNEHRFCRSPAYAHVASRTFEARGAADQ